MSISLSPRPSISLLTRSSIECSRNRTRFLSIELSISNDQQEVFEMNQPEDDESNMINQSDHHDHFTHSLNLQQMTDHIPKLRPSMSISKFAASLSANTKIMSGTRTSETETSVTTAGNGGNSSSTVQLPSDASVTSLSKVRPPRRKKKERMIRPTTLKSQIQLELTTSKLPLVNSFDFNSKITNYNDISPFEKCIPMSEIFPNLLYVGTKDNLSDRNSTETFSKNNITTVISILSGRDFESLSYNNFILPKNVKKHEKFNLSDRGNENIKQYFETVTKIIQESKESKDQGAVFIHCHKGISRSVTLCIAYILSCVPNGIEPFVNLPYERPFDYVQDALSFVRRKRPIAEPNLGFIGQLSEYARGTKMPK